MSPYPRALTLSVFLFLSVSLVAQANIQPVTTTSDYSKEAFYYEKYVHKVQFENDGTSLTEVVARIKVQSDAGVQHFGLLTFPYASGTDSLVIDHVQVIKPDGSVVLTPPDTFQDMPTEITRQAPFYSDLREKHVAVKGLSPGDILDYQCHTRTTKPLASGQFWFAYNFSRDFVLLQETLEVKVPAQRSIRLKSGDIKPVVADAGAYRTYTWTNSNLKPREKNEKIEQFKNAWEQARGRIPLPEILLSSFQSWEDVGRWYDALQRDHSKPTPEIQAKAAELTKGLSDDDARLRAIYKYASQQFRYIGIAFGIGRYQPHSASEVLDNQYGDCKDKHTLLAALLTAAGFKAYPALLSTTSQIDADLPSPSLFNHVITAVARPSGLIWLDSTTEVGHFQYLAPPERNKQALVIWDDKAPGFVTTPSELPFRPVQDFRFKGKVSSGGVLEGSADLTVRGDSEIVLRALYRRVPLPQWKQLTQNIAGTLGFGGDVSDVTASAPEKTDEPFHLSYKYTRKNFGNWEENQTVAPMPVMSIPSAGDDNTVSSPVPLWLGPNIDLTFHSEVEYPAGHTVEPSAPIHQHFAFADYDASYSFKNGILTVDRHLHTTATEVHPAVFAEYRKFFKIVSDDYAAYLTVNSPPSLVASRAAATHSLNEFAPPVSSNSVSTPPPPTNSFLESIRNLPDSTNKEGSRLFAEGSEALLKNDMQTATTSMYRAVAADPKFIRAWITLASLLTSLRQTEAGVEAFQKAIEADPKQPITYKAYGFALMASSKYAESVPIWQTYIKLSPDDSDGPANLASSLMESKRYDAAADTLETALKMRPDTIPLQWSLADAYTQMGKEDQASSVYQKLLLSDSPVGTFNNTAYELAESGKLLPIALQFANKAVQSLEKESTGIDLAKLGQDDLRMGWKLATFWDTLGWVEYRMAHSESAERYLKSAWVVSQSSYVADHLCSVYESAHKKQAAIRMCQLSLHRMVLENHAGPYDVAAELAKARKRLDTLSPGASKNASTGPALDEVVRMRTFKLPRLTTGNINAEFYVLIVSDPTTKQFKVQDAKFISGSEKLKPFAKSLSSITLNMPSPDGQPTRFVRRGTLGCYQYSGCEFILLDPSSTP